MAASAAPPLINNMATVMARTGLPRSTLWEHLADGTLRSFKVGRRRMVTEDALREFVAWLEKRGES
jgi:excisionase family DNA binding protein